MVFLKEQCYDFLLYVNNFSEKMEGENDIVQFADNTSIIRKIILKIMKIFH